MNNTIFSSILTQIIIHFTPGFSEKFFFSSRIYLNARNANKKYVDDYLNATFTAIAERQLKTINCNRFLFYVIGLTVFIWYLLHFLLFLSFFLFKLKRYMVLFWFHRFIKYQKYCVIRVQQKNTFKNYERAISILFYIFVIKCYNQNSQNLK